MQFRRLLALSFALTLLLATAASAAVAPRPWPPAEGPGTLFAHFGEEHINDEDGATLLPAVVSSVTRYGPGLVTMSGDKANDGQADQFQLWLSAMEPFERARIPFFAGTGNHDRTSPPGAPTGTAGLFFGTTPESFDIYKAFFASRPYPWGDARPYRSDLLDGRPRPTDDPQGAAATYWVDAGNTRWIFLDNSCWSFTNCEPFQARAEPVSGTQLEWFRARAKEATDTGKTVFVVMHIPTRDPRDQSYTDFTAQQHTMGKSTSPDNQEFERIAASTGVDGVFVGHIKGQFVYEGQGGVPYYIDGGAGGELYTTGPVGVDHGYWHGYRLVRVSPKGTVTTDTVPIFVPGGITIEGPASVARGAQQSWQAFGRQPVFNDPAKVERLELRDPDPRKPESGMDLSGLVFLAPAGLLIVLVPLASAWGGMTVARRRVLAPLAGAAALGVCAIGAVAVAQQDEPTLTEKGALPSPARIWASSDPAVLAPVAAADDDPRRDPATQTDGGSFRGVCPGKAVLSVTSGWERSERLVTVPSRDGSIVRSLSRRRSARVGRRVRAVSVRLAQPAVVSLRVMRGGRTVARSKPACVTSSRALAFRPSRRGRHTVEVRIRSDRRTIVRRHRLAIR